LQKSCFKTATYIIYYVCLNKTELNWTGSCPENLFADISLQSWGRVLELGLLVDKIQVA